MPRGGRRTSSRSPTRSSFASTRPTTQRPPQTQPTQTSSGGMFGGLGSTLMTGMAFGAGS